MGMMMNRPPRHRMWLEIRLRIQETILSKHVGYFSWRHLRSSTYRRILRKWFTPFTYSLKHRTRHHVNPDPPVLKPPGNLVSLYLFAVLSYSKANDYRMNLNHLGFAVRMRESPQSLCHIPLYFIQARSNLWPGRSGCFRGEIVKILNLER
jgi:hypothetical protein